jgi:hypothetical protein
LALRKALSPNNIKKGFSAIGIYPLNRHAIDRYINPSETFQSNSGGGSGRESLTSSPQEGSGLQEGEGKPKGPK